MKKMLAILLSVLMAFGMVTTAFADGEESAPTTQTTGTIKVSEDDNHTYAVYQIFTGDYYNGVLSNVKVGENGQLPEGTSLESALQELENLKKSTGITDSDKLAVIKNYFDANSTTERSVSENAPLTVPAGYYLIKDNGSDVDGSVADGETYSLFVVEVVGGNTVTIAPKRGTTSSEKKVKDDEGANTDWNDSADYDIGDNVPFQLKATVASDYDNYANGYKLTFHDHQFEGLTFNQDSVKVYVDGTEITTGFEVIERGSEKDDPCTFEVVFANLKNVTSVKAGSVITVEYTSTLNTNAVIGAVGNPNTMHITYTNNPNDNQAGENGKTPDDTVIVFTYEVKVDKYATEVKEDAKLTGAEFTLTKGKDETKETIAVVKSEDGASFNFKGLDAGTYTLTETVTPAGYNTIAPITVVITATHDVEADAPALKTLVVTPAESFTVEMSSEGEDATPTGTITGNVINFPGVTLPTTGGMGTTLFYVVGAILVLGAGILLIAKKRMTNR